MSKQLHMNWSPFYVFFVQKKCKRLNSEIFLNLDFFLLLPFRRLTLVSLLQKKIFSLLFASCPFVVADNFSFSLSGGRYLLSVPFMQSIINHAGRSCWILGSLISEALCKKKRTAFLLLMWISLGLKRIWLYSIAGAFWSTLNVHAFLFWAKRMLDSPIFLTFAGDWWTIRDLGKEYICNSS